MLRDEFLAKMLVQAATPRNFDDWADILGEFANCLEKISPRLEDSERDWLLSIGSSFYRTLAQAENYRQTSVRRD